VEIADRIQAEAIQDLGAKANNVLISQFQCAAGYFLGKINGAKT
jgi:hypothetical protein